MRISIIFISLIFFSNAISQESINFWSDAMTNTYHAENRTYASEKFNLEIEGFLKEKGFAFEGEMIPEITTLVAPDTSFKLISWQIDHGNNKFEYFTFLIDSLDQLIKFQDVLDELEDMEYLELTSSECIGGIFYDIIQMENDYYTFSYRQVDEFRKQKVFDVLWKEDGKWVFGKEAFAIPGNGTRDDIKTRILFEYSADATLSLNYNAELGMVIHDHLMPVMGRMPGQGPTSVPDGTYEGFKFEEGKWTYVEKIFDHVYEKAPRPVPVLDEKSKDLFGKKKKTKN